MLYFTSPSSFRNSNAHYSNGDSSILPNIHPHLRYPQVSMSPAYSEILPPHSSHPNFSHLTLLVFEAVLEVVCVSLPGYILARQGLFSEDMQKFVAYLNILLFTPCLSMCTVSSLVCANKQPSFHQISISIDSGQTRRSCGDTTHLRCSGWRILLVLPHYRKSFWLQQKTTQFCNCYGSKNLSPVDDYLLSVASN